MEKIDTRDLPRGVKLARTLFTLKDQPIRLVGGCVRDMIQGKAPKDYDLCTPAKPDAVFQILDEGGMKPFDLSNGHGTVSYVYEYDTYEITTLRVDAETDGRHATVEFVEDFALDAERRDFTFNALSADISTGKIYDYFGGVNDLMQNEVRFVGDPDKRIQEDYLRILRYFRFLGRMDNSPADDQTAAIERNVAGLDKVSGERIWMEVQKILTGPNTDYVMFHMKRTGVWDRITSR